MSFYPLESTSNLTEGYSRQFIIDGKDMLLVHSGGLTRLISTACPHNGYPLKKAKLTHGCIQCPKHRICFSLENGEALGGDAVADVPSLSRYELAEENGETGIYI
jgi:nitrite reductase/ring-hydroxylating ferredoxin subunit